MTDVSDLASRLDSTLARLGATQSVAELHGTLVGLLCAKGSVDKEEWLSQLVPATAEGGLQPDERDSLSQLHGETLKQLNDPVLDFEPLLPEEEEPLQERIEALSEWCQGFLFGLAEGGIADLKRLPGDASEVVGDLVNISRAENYDLAGTEEDEEAYSELLEYVRAGVLLVNEELNPTKAAPRGDTTLH